MNKPRGRPRGGGGAARAELLRCAAESFAERGYAATTLRSVATAAGVDPALVAYYFGSKQGLFTAAMQVSLGPGDVLRTALAAPPAAVPARLAAAVVGTWEHPVHGPALVALLTAAVADESARRGFAEYIDREVLAVLAEHLPGAGAGERASAVASVLSGAVLTRYVLRLPGTANLDAAAFAATLVAPLQAALGGGVRRRQADRGGARPRRP